MKSSIHSKLAICATACFAFSILAGCSNDAAVVPVSGTITLDGAPLPGVLVVFMPQAVEGNIAPGPYSEGTTDANGKYTLMTRHKKPGACIGTHSVSFQYGDIDEEAAADAETDAQEAKGEGGAAVDAEAAGEKESKKQLKGRKRIPKRYGEDNSTVTIVIETGGTDSADFPLTSN